MDIKRIKEKDLNLPPMPAIAPQIDWGEDFLNWDVTKQNRYLKRLCSALNHATDLIQKERNELSRKLEERDIILKNADKNVATHKDIVIRAITSHNEEKQKLISTIQLLEKEVKELKQKLEFIEQINKD